MLSSISHPSGPEHRGGIHPPPPSHATRSPPPPPSVHFASSVRVQYFDKATESFCGDEEVGVTLYSPKLLKAIRSQPPVEYLDLAPLEALSAWMRAEIASWKAADLSLAYRPSLWPPAAH